MTNKDYLDWVEKAAIENLRGRLATGDVLLAQSNTLLSLLLVGIGGSLAYVVKLLEGSAASPLVVGMSSVSVWLFLVAAVLAFNCLFTRETQVLYNEPKSLRNDTLKSLNLSFEDLRGFELENIQERIEKTELRNRCVAMWLDRCRGAAVATPVVFTVAALGSAYL
ncbi:hypothetical protein CLV01_3199 [Delftia sp. 60]|uniref:hypothetical protein n=1 Tax=Delftia sp. 60 TaxID=2035216 RepID=UPI000C181EFD|nr:hypothetical protein [Delftia sp. 60]PIF38016.1 hypothetical protein CLU98_3250 [Burkholderiales bacterium 23]PIF66803.1 hypothetical protein CLV01_3199 [Delftia sp. 60]